MIRRALVAGAGSIGLRHLRLLREALPEAEIQVLRHSICDEEIEYADGCFSELEQACKFAPELAVIASPAPFHIPHAIALAKTGTHLLVEKPASDSSNGVSELVSFCAERGQVLQIGYNMRFLEALQTFRSKIAAGLIGEVYTVRCDVGQYLPSWRPGIDYRKSVSAQKALGGGVLLELSHELDMMRWIFGEVEWLSAWTGRQSKLEIDVEDVAMLQLGFACGALAQINMDFLRHDTTRTCTAIGSNGTICFDAIKGRVDFFDPSVGRWMRVTKVKPERDASYTSQIANLLTAISETSRQPAELNVKNQIAATGNDGLAVMRLIEAARISNTREGIRVKVDKLHE